METARDQISFVEEYLQNEKEIISLLEKLEPLLKRREELESLWPQVRQIRGPVIQNSSFKLKRTRNGNWKKEATTEVVSISSSAPPKKKRKITSNLPLTPEESAKRRMDKLEKQLEERGGPPPTTSSGLPMDVTQNFNF